jgi:hypothetical protein
LHIPEELIKEIEAGLGTAVILGIISMDIVEHPYEVNESFFQYLNTTSILPVNSNPKDRSLALVSKIDSEYKLLSQQLEKLYKSVANTRE